MTRQGLRHELELGVHEDESQHRLGIRLGPFKATGLRRTDND